MIILVSELNGEAKLQEPQEMDANIIQSSDTGQL